MLLSKPMEIKITCGSCDTKFAFDVEPIHGRMPAPVNCPECGLEATEQANAEIQSSLAASSPGHPAPAPAAIPAPAGVPLRVAAPATPPQLASPASAAGPLRINRPVARPPSTGSAEAESDYGLQSATPPPTISARPSGSSEGKGALVKAISTVLVLLCAGFGAWRVGSKWFKRLNLVAQIASAVGQASVAKGDEDDGGARNLWYEDEAVLFIKHTNHVDIANACKVFWKDQLRRDLSVTNTLEQSGNSGEYELIAAHNGYVRIVGAFQWPIKEHEALAQHLSQKFGTMVFEWRSEHVADTYHFGVYDQGARKFHAQMDVKLTRDDAIEKVTTEGNEFAMANGYKPGPEGFKEFNVLDADKITQRLGMKLWDEKDDTVPKGATLKEVGAAAAAARKAAGEQE
jgi:hypothetical protein